MPSVTPIIGGPLPLQSKPRQLLISPHRTTPGPGPIYIDLGSLVGHDARRQSYTKSWSNSLFDVYAPFIQPPIPVSDAGASLIQPHTLVASKPSRKQLILRRFSKSDSTSAQGKFHATRQASTAAIKQLSDAVKLRFLSGPKLVLGFNPALMLPKDKIERHQMRSALSKQRVKPFLQQSPREKGFYDALSQVLLIVPESRKNAKILWFYLAKDPYHWDRPLLLKIDTRIRDHYPPPGQNCVTVRMPYVDDRDKPDLTVKVIYQSPPELRGMKKKKMEGEGNKTEEEKKEEELEYELDEEELEQVSCSNARAHPTRAKPRIL